MKKMNFKNILFSAALAAGAMSLASCSLEEENRVTSKSVWIRHRSSLV